MTEPTQPTWGSPAQPGQPEPPTQRQWGTPPPPSQPQWGAAQQPSQPQWGAPPPPSQPAPPSQPQWGAPGSGATPPGAPVPPGQFPPGAAFPPGGAPQEPKKGNNRRLASIIGTLVVIAIAIGIRVIPGLIQEAQWKEGACLDYYPTSIIEFDVDPKIVDCSGDSAVSKIVAVLDADAPIADCAPYNSEATVEDDSHVYCLVEV